MISNSPFEGSGSFFEIRFHLSSSHLLSNLVQQPSKSILEYSRPVLRLVNSHRSRGYEALSIARIDNLSDSPSSEIRRFDDTEHQHEYGECFDSVSRLPSTVQIPFRHPTSTKGWWKERLKMMFKYEGVRPLPTSPERPTLRRV